MNKMVYTTTSCLQIIHNHLYSSVIKRRYFENFSNPQFDMPTSKLYVLKPRLINLCFIIFISNVFLKI